MYDMYGISETTAPQHDDMEGYITRTIAPSHTRKSNCITRTLSYWEQYDLEHFGYIWEDTKPEYNPRFRIIDRITYTRRD